MPLIILLLGIGILILLIAWLRINAFIALILVSFGVGLAEGMPVETLIKSVQYGIGSTLGSLIMVLGIGVMLGKLLSESGAALQISVHLIHFFGKKNIKIAMMMTGLLVGIAMFYNAGFVVLMPLVFTLALTGGYNPVYLGIPVAAALSVTHGFLPPHPGPTAIAEMFKADVGRTLIYGIIVSVPAICIAGWFLPEWISKIPSHPPPELFAVQEKESIEKPSFWVSAGVGILPVLCMGIASFCKFFTIQNPVFAAAVLLIGDPGIAIMLSYFIGLYLLGIRRGLKIKDLMKSAESSIGGIALMLLIIGGGGAFKQVLIDSGIGTFLSDFLKQVQLSPLLLGWLIAVFIRLALGSATVAGLTAAGIVQPFLASSGVSPELMVLAIGAGSLFGSHVNDSGFWMFKEYFRLSLKSTFATWTVMESMVSVVGLMGVLILQFLI